MQSAPSVVVQEERRTQSPTSFHPLVPSFASSASPDLLQVAEWVATELGLPQYKVRPAAWSQAQAPR